MNLFKEKEYRLNKRYRIKDAAQMLGLNPSQVYRLIQQNRIKVAGRKPLRVTLEGLRQWLRSRYPSIEVIFGS